MNETENNVFQVICTGATGGKKTHKRAKINVIYLEENIDGNGYFIDSEPMNGQVNDHNWKPPADIDTHEGVAAALAASSRPNPSQDHVPGWSDKSWKFKCGRCQRDFRRDEQKLVKALLMLQEQGINTFDISLMEKFC